jgi:hypothetical protein
MPNCWEIRGLASVSIFARTTLPVGLARLALEQRPELTARPAPLGPEVHDDRRGLRAVQHLGLEVGFRDVDDGHGP